MSATPPKTIDDVIARLEEIIEDCIATENRLGYFAALYNRVTQAVKQGIATGEFEDGPRMERLDVTFASRYLAAYDQYRAGEVPSRSWLKAFEAAKDPRLTVLQHLLIAMNAHINLDLGVAAARTCPGPALAPLKNDFGTINTVLSKLTPTVQGEIDRESPFFIGLTQLLKEKTELEIVGVAMDGARELSWALAVQLAPLPVAQQTPLIATRDAETAALADLLLDEGPIERFVRHFEFGSVAENIRVLATGEFGIPDPGVFQEPPQAAQAV
jgi:Family of unknown function (DUF5995)